MTIFLQSIFTIISESLSWISLLCSMVKMVMYKKEDGVLKVRSSCFKIQLNDKYSRDEAQLCVLV